MRRLKIFFVLVFISSIVSAITASRHYDVTTLYRLNGMKSGELSAEVHARTNALGLPFEIIENGSRRIIVPDVEGDVPSWQVGDTNSWRVKNWRERQDSFLESAVLPEGLPSDINWHQSTLIPLETDADSHTLDVYFIPAGTSGCVVIKVLLEPELYIRVCSNYYDGGVYTCCADRGYYDRYNLPGLTPGTRCNRDSQISALESSWRIGTVYRFNIELTESTIRGDVYYNQEWHNFINREMDLFWSDSISYYFFTENFGGMAFKKDDVYFGKPYLELAGIDGEMKSRAFLPSFEKLCVTVISSMTPQSGSSLELHVEETSSDNRLIVGTINSSEILDLNLLGWTSHRFSIELPEEFQNTLLQLVLTASKHNDGHIFIHNISSCNAYGNEETITLPKSAVADFADLSRLPAYSVTEQSPVIMIQGSEKFCPGGCSHEETALQNDHDANNCLNGGSYDVQSESCICVAGFTGSLCEQGCGRNRFGNDCGGFCSGSLDECRRILLCRPGSTCKCAPGFKGEDCGSDCDAGEYGANCQQTCGHCRVSPCDPYTGTCDLGCQSGFFPPFCKTRYASLKSPPEVIGSAFHSLTIRIDLNSSNIQGEGTPRFYQVQYRAKGALEWLEQPPEEIPKGEMQASDMSSEMSVERNITYLPVGKFHNIRVVLIDEDGESYSGDTIEYSEGQTSCTVPHEVNYEVLVSHVEINGFHLDWNYEPRESTWCPVTHFEVHVYEGSRWVVHELPLNGTSYSLVISDMLQSSKFYVKVRAVTANGKAEFSKLQVITTKLSEPGKVRNLQETSVASSEIKIRWDEPLSPDGDDLKYDVRYECRYLLACSSTNCSYSSGHVTVTGNSARLRNLLPHAQYYITVAAVHTSVGPVTSILATTNYTVASVAADLGEVPVTDCTNSSFTFHWSRPADCSKLNGYLYAYHYELLLANTSSSSASSSPMQEGRTEGTSATFTGLLPHTNYEVRVYLIASAGLDWENALVYFVTTKATVPGPVGDLTVYKRSKRLLSLRWSLPRDMYGDLQSFTVSYYYGSGKQEEKSLVVRPELCVAWPDLYCHTLTQLRPNKDYTITVQARNTEVLDDGEPSVVRTTTQEGGAPSAPVGLKLVNRTDTSITVSWMLPHMLNGIMRSFVVNIEQADSHNYSACCKYYPLQEIPVDGESMSYISEFRDLMPSSKYSISISGKTVALGPSATLSLATQPQVPVGPLLPEVASTVEYGSPVSVTLHPPAVDETLLRGFLVLVKLHDQVTTVPQTKVYDSELNGLLNTIVNGSFYVAAELQLEELEDTKEVVIGILRQPTTGELSQSEDKVLDRGEYSIGLATVLSYCDVYNAGYVQSHKFTVI